MGRHQDLQRRRTAHAHNERSETEMLTSSPPITIPTLPPNLSTFDSDSRTQMNGNAIAPTDEAISVAAAPPTYGHKFSSFSILPPPIAIQAKLTVNAPNDVYEQEADRVAEQVMHQEEPTVALKPQRIISRLHVQRCPACGGSDPDEPLCPACAAAQEAGKNPLVSLHIQRCPACGGSDPDEPLCPACAAAQETIQKKPLVSFITPYVQRAAAPFPQPSAIGPSLSIERQLSESKSSGSALPTDVRTFMETRFGTDFSQVRVHTDGEAVQLSRDLHAQAFTHKQDVYFGAGKAPAKDALTAHELTHVLQQMGTVQTKSDAPDLVGGIQRSPEVSLVTEPRIQKWPFDDDEDKENKEKDTDDSPLDWVTNKASAVASAVTEAGGDAYNWAKEQGGAAINSVVEAGKDAYNSVTDAAAQQSYELLTQKKATAAGQISGVIQKFAGPGSVPISADQLAALNGHLTTLRGTSQGNIAVDGLAAQPDEGGSLVVSTASIQGLLQQLQASLASPFLSPAPPNTTVGSDATQEPIQRVAILAAPALGAALIIAALQALAIIIIVLAIIWLMSKAIDLIKEKEKEKAEEEAKKKECKDVHDAYKALKCPSCSPTDTPAERAIKIACIEALIAGRQSWLDKRCDYIMDGSIKRGSPDAESGHQIQVAQEMARLKKCQAMSTTT